jgi:hypothetical protein
LSLLLSALRRHSERSEESLYLPLLLLLSLVLLLPVILTLSEAKGKNPHFARGAKQPASASALKPKNKSENPAKFPHPEKRTSANHLYHCISPRFVHQKTTFNRQFS